jgi:hypothetical protein
MPPSFGGFCAKARRGWPLPLLPHTRNTPLPPLSHRELELFEMSPQRGNVALSDKPAYGFFFHGARRGLPLSPPLLRRSPFCRPQVPTLSRLKCEQCASEKSPERTLMIFWRETLVFEKISQHCFPALPLEPRWLLKRRSWRRCRRRPSLPMACKNRVVCVCVCVLIRLKAHWRCARGCRWRAGRLRTSPTDHAR